MNRSLRMRSLVLLTFGMTLLTVLSVSAWDDTQTAKESDPYLGTWGTTSATTSILLDIKPGGEVLNLLIESGSHGLIHDTWKPLPGGILVDGVPRFRIWKGRHNDEIRVEMEPLPADLTSEGLQKFPRTFFMRRAAFKHEIPKAVAARPLPAAWMEPKLPKDWDETAGTRREAISQ